MNDFEDDASEQIGTALGLIRQCRDISQESLAGMLTAAAGETVTTENVARVEAGRIRVSWERLALFCRCFGCLPSQVVRLAEMLRDGRSDSEEAATLLQSLQK